MWNKKLFSFHLNPFCQGICTLSPLSRVFLGVPFVKGLTLLSRVLPFCQGSCPFVKGLALLSRVLPFCQGSCPFVKGLALLSRVLPFCQGPAFWQGSCPGLPFFQGPVKGFYNLLTRLCAACVFLVDFCIESNLFQLQVEEDTIFVHKLAWQLCGFETHAAWHAKPGHFPHKVLPPPIPAILGVYLFGIEDEVVEHVEFYSDIPKHPIFTFGPVHQILIMIKEPFAKVHCLTVLCPAEEKVSLVKQVHQFHQGLKRLDHALM